MYLVIVLDNITAEYARFSVAVVDKRFNVSISGTVSVSEVCSDGQTLSTSLLNDAAVSLA